MATSVTVVALKYKRGGVDNGGSRVGLGWGEENEGGCHGE